MATQTENQPASPPPLCFFFLKPLPLCSSFRLIGSERHRGKHRDANQYGRNLCSCFIENNDSSTGDEIDLFGGSPNS